MEGESTISGLTLITPTGDRPEMFKMCEWLMSRQTFTGEIQWIVVDDGVVPTECLRGQEYIRNKPNLATRITAKTHTVGSNLRLALPRVKFNKILVIEDDDYYSPKYLQFYYDQLDRYSLVGESGAKYYRLDNYTYQHFNTGGYLRHAALARTGFTSNLLNFVERQCPGTSAVDSRIWEAYRGSRKLLKPSVSGLHVSIKKGPGRTNKKHNLRLKYSDTENCLQLLTWTKGDWQAIERYQQIHRKLLTDDIVSSKGDWAVGVTTAPRQRSTLSRCIQSLKTTGFEDPVVFSEPQVIRDVSNTKVVIRPKVIEKNIYGRIGHLEKFGVWRNYFQTLDDLIHLFPNASKFLISQDDVVYCRDLRRYLDQFVWPSDAGLLSLYCPSSFTGITNTDYEVPNFIGFRKITHVNLVGALAFVFKRETVLKLLKSKYCKNWKGMANGYIKDPSKKKAIDACIGTAIRSFGQFAYYVVPSLAQHISKVSTLGYGANTGFRRSRLFPGEDVSVFDVLGDLRMGVSKPRVSSDSCTCDCPGYCDNHFCVKSERDWEICKGINCTKSVQSRYKVAWEQKLKMP